MPTTRSNDRTFDARPDRIDLRDRPYQPKLVSLPPLFPDLESIRKYLPDYAKALVLDQGREGACTGFGLAATINYLRWRNNGYSLQGIKSVSPRMLYHMAQLYDEWPGEDYEGSSCRGAMKGWNRHGVCSEALWPSCNEAGVPGFVAPGIGWDKDAAQLPLGAYYRIDKASITDLQSAVVEVGAIYCSANVHEGWFIGKTEDPQIIPWQNNKPVGGHAFAIVGYTQDGFIVQNSWGAEKWGHHGFAILSYQDWVFNSTDAWVAVLGAPMSVLAPETISPRSSLDTSSSLCGPAGLASSPGRGFSYANPEVQPLPEDKAYLCTLVLGNNGIPINRLLTSENAAKAVERVCRTEPATWLGNEPSDKPCKLALYVHGGLNSEEDSVQRIRIMAPYFRANKIYPLFLTWKTGALESIGGILEDSTRDIFRSLPSMRDESVMSKVREALDDARDRTIEVACEHLLVKPIWSEMKQNASAAAFPDAGLAMLAGHLIALKQQFPKLEIHLAGHSAGSIVLGHLLSLLGESVPVSTLSLFAPACTVEFAVATYGAAIKSGKLQPEAVHVDIMSDERERADTVGPYGKSLLYLVSRALEVRHKTPLLGMEWSWKSNSPQDQWSADDSSRNALQAWAGNIKGMSLHVHDKRREYVSTGAGKIRLAHGSFDNDVTVISNMLQRIRGGELLAEVENLAY
uniref:Cysteine protease n=1 Tax=Desulfovibrio sp. U5L TaxID=596152 RepID=I2Q584_9BACT